MILTSETLDGVKKTMRMRREDGEFQGAVMQSFSQNGFGTAGPPMSVSVNFCTLPNLVKQTLVATECPPRPRIYLSIYMSTL